MGVTVAATGVGRLALTLTGSVGATTGGTGFGCSGGVGSGGVGSGGGATGSSTIRLLLGAESRTPLGLPLPRFSTAAGISLISWTFSDNSCEFSAPSAICSTQEKNYLMVMVNEMLGSPVRIE